MNQHSELEEAMDVFFEHYCKTHPQLETLHDVEWSSPCEEGLPFKTPLGAMTVWQPQRRQHEPIDGLFERLENALELNIHPDIKTHYERYWSAHLEAQAPQGPVSLLYLWNTEDEARLLENLIGHAVACRHNRVPFSVFFACTDVQSDYYLTVNNDSGTIQLETPGKLPTRTICESLGEFYDLLVPAEPEQLKQAQHALAATLR